MLVFLLCFTRNRTIKFLLFDDLKCFDVPRLEIASMKIATVWEAVECFVEDRGCIRWLDVKKPKNGLLAVSIILHIVVLILLFAAGRNWFC